MTTLALVSAFALAGWLTWRGSRRGALATVVGLGPFSAALAVVLAFLWLAWAAPGSFSLLVVVGLVAGLASGVGLRVALRSLEGRAARALARCGERGWVRWARAMDKASGAALGLVTAALLVLTLASLGSTLAFSMAVSDEGCGAGARRSAWVEALGGSCEALADISHFGILAHIPRMRVYSREVRALIKVLNAPPHKLRYVAAKNGIAELARVPEVREAVLDEDYMALVKRLAHGDVGALPALVRDPVTRRVVRCPRVRELAAKLTPSKLARDLASAPPADPAR